MWILQILYKIFQSEFGQLEILFNIESNFGEYLETQLWRYWLKRNIFYQQQKIKVYWI